MKSEGEFESISEPKRVKEIWDESTGKLVARVHQVGDFKRDYNDIEAQLLAHAAARRATCEFSLLSYVCRDDCYAKSAIHEPAAPRSLDIESDLASFAQSNYGIPLESSLGMVALARTDDVLWKHESQPRNFTEWRKRSGWLFAIHWRFERWAQELYADEWRWMQNNKRRIWHGCELAGPEAPWYAKWVSRVEFRLRGWSDPRTRNEPTWKRLLSVFRSGSPK